MAKFSELSPLVTSYDTALIAVTYGGASRIMTLDTLFTKTPIAMVATRATTLTGLSTATAAAIAATDTVLEAFGKLQAQVNGKLDDDQATDFGLALLGAVDVAAQRNALGLANHEKLSVSVDSVNGQVTLVGGSSGNITLGQFANGAWLGNSGVGAAGPFRFGVASGEAFRISELRNVLVGITTDNGSDMLQVGGSGLFDGVSIKGYADTDGRALSVWSNRNNGAKPRADIFAFGSDSAVNYMGQKAATAGLYTAFADMVLTADTNNKIQLYSGGIEYLRVSPAGVWLILIDAPDDAAAATAGVPVGAIYRTGTTLKVRAA